MRCCRATKTPTAADLPRALIDRIVMDPANGKLDIPIEGDAAGVLSFASVGKELPATKARCRQVPMDAGVRFEPVRSTRASRGFRL